MTHFISALREAHAVVTAFERGAQDIETLCQRTGLRFGAVWCWTQALNLHVVKVEHASAKRRFRYGSRITGSYASPGVFGHPPATLAWAPE